MNHTHISSIIVTHAWENYKLFVHSYREILADQTPSSAPAPPSIFAQMETNKITSTYISMLATTLTQLGPFPILVPSNELVTHHKHVLVDRLKEVMLQQLLCR